MCDTNYKLVLPSNHIQLLHGFLDSHSQPIDIKSFIFTVHSLPPFRYARAICLLLKMAGLDDFLKSGVKSVRTKV